MWVSDAADWAGGILMHLKLFVLSASSVVLWLAPLVVLDKRLDIHKALQGVSLTAAIACAVTAGNIARELSEQGEIEAIKKRAITADVVDEISTSAYISQQQRQQEAELILTCPGVDVEESRKALEAIYSNDLQDTASATSILITLYIWKFVSQGKRESQPPGLLRIFSKWEDENSQMAR
jgi:hypothetical protein